MYAVVTYLADQCDHIEGGYCDVCDVHARHRTCETCGDAQWILDCGHMPQPAPIAATEDGQRLICEDCADESPS